MSFLDGFAHTYESSSPGIIVKTLCKLGSKRGIIFFDEFDKLSQTEHGLEVSRSLLHIVDTTQNSEFRDKYLSELKIDLSHIWFIFSLNDENSIDQILRDRIPILKIYGYSFEDKLNIAKKYLIPKILNSMKFNETDVVFTDDVLRHICSKWSDAGVRKIKECFERISRKMLFLKTIHQNNPSIIQVPFDIPNFRIPITITMENLGKLIDEYEFNENISKLMMYT